MPRKNTRRGSRQQSKRAIPKKRPRVLTWQPSKLPKLGDLIWIQPRDRRRKPVLHKVVAVSSSDR